jgi:hypothetical protein
MSVPGVTGNASAFMGMKALAGIQCPSPGATGDVSADENEWLNPESRHIRSDSAATYLRIPNFTKLPSAARAVRRNLELESTCLTARQTTPGLSHPPVLGGFGQSFGPAFFLLRLSIAVRMARASSVLPAKAFILHERTGIARGTRCEFDVQISTPEPRKVHSDASRPQPFRPLSMPIMMVLDESSGR